MKEIINIIKKKWLRDTMLTILLVLILITAFVGLNIWVQSLDVTAIDITEEKLHTISEETKNQIKNIDKDVTICFFGFDEEASQVDIAKQYTKINEKIKCEIIDVTNNPDLANEYGITSEDQVILVMSGDRNKLLSINDLSTTEYGSDYTSYEVIDLTEQKLTNAILDTTIAEKPMIYCLTGHGEYNPLSYSEENTMLAFSGYLQNEVNEVQTLNLLSVETFPENCDVLVIATPTKDFLDKEAELIIQYVNKGGKIFFLNDLAYEKIDMPNVQKILDLFGVTLSQGLVVEQDSTKMLSGSPAMVIPTLNSSHKITQYISEGKGIVVLPYASVINIADTEKLTELNVTQNVLISTSEKAFLRTDVKNLNLNVPKTAEEQEGELTIGAEFVKKIDDNTESKMIVYANNIFLSDYTIAVGSQNVPTYVMYNNMDLALNTVSYLNERDDTITIRKSMKNVSFTPTETQDMVIQIIIFSVPVAIILSGIVVWQVRRRKK